MSELKSEKITIFKEVFNYYYDGDITKEQLADLLLLHYETRWGDGVEVKDIQDKDVRMIWRTLQHTVAKSVRNAKDYENRKSNKTNDLNPSKPVEQIPQPVVDNSSESLKMANNDNREIPAEFAIDEPVRANVRLDNILTIPVNKPSLFSDYLTKLVYLHKKDTIGSITAYEEIEKEEVLDGMRNILLSSGYAADSVDDTIEECVTSTIAA